MGCGASAKGHPRYAVNEDCPQPSGTTYSEIEQFTATEHSPRGKRKTVGFADDSVSMYSSKSTKSIFRPMPEPEPLELSELVLCIATRPDWPKADFLVFSEKRKEQQTDDHGGWSAPEQPDHWARSTRANGTTVAGTAGKAPKMRNKPKAAEKCGNFYSRTNREIGTWKINGNALDLRWGDFRESVISAEDPRKWANTRSGMKVEVTEPARTPQWFLPDVLAPKRFAESMAQTAFECPVCFFELSRQTPGVMRKNSRRSCGHYLHHMCGQFLIHSVRGTRIDPICPLCAQPFNEVKAMPDLAQDPKAWFACCDTDFGGELDRYEVVEALGTILPGINRTKLEKVLSTHWGQWDPDGDGTITMEEFVRPKSGLQAYILSMVTTARRDVSKKAPPSLDRNPRAWFEHWDRDGNGTLDREEMRRAMVRTFCMTEFGDPIMHRAMEMKGVIEAMWVSIGYDDIDEISFQEFARPFGIMDQVLHNDTHCRFFGDDDEIVLL